MIRKKQENDQDKEMVYQSNQFNKKKMRNV